MSLFVFLLVTLVLSLVQASCPPGTDYKNVALRLKAKPPSVVLAPNAASPCEEIVAWEIKHSNYSRLAEAGLIASWFPPEVTVPLYEKLAITLDYDFMLTPIDSFSDPQTEDLYPRKWMSLVKNLVLFLSPSGTLFCLLVFLAVRTRRAIPYEEFLLVPFGVYTLALLYWSPPYAIGLVTILSLGTYLMSIPPPRSEVPGTLTYHFTATFTVLAFVVFLASYLPLTSLSPAVSFLPLFALPFIALSLTAFGASHLHSLPYSYSAFVSLVLATLFVTMLTFVDQMPILFHGSPISSLLLPTLIKTFKMFPSALTFQGYLSNLLKAGSCFFTSSDPEVQEMLNWICTHPTLVWFLCHALPLFPPFRAAYLKLPLIFQRRRFDSPPVVVPSPTFQNYLLALTTNLETPVWKIFSLTDNVFISLFLNPADTKIRPFNDLYALYLMISFITKPMYFVQYIIFLGLLKIFLLPVSPPVPEATVSTKLAQLRNLFPRNLPLSKFLDVAPDGVIHTLYTIYVTGTRTEPPVHFKTHCELFQALSEIVPPNDQETLIRTRIHEIDETIRTLPPHEPVPSPPPTSATVPKTVQRRNAAIASSSVPIPSTQAHLSIEHSLLPESTQAAPEILDRVLGSTVVLHAGTSVFSGFRVAPRTICTVSHGQKKPSEITSPNVVIQGGKHLPALDLMFLRTEKTGRYLTVSENSNPKPDDSVLLVTLYPTKIVNHGVVLHSSVNALLTQLPTHPGSSGSAVISLTGSVLGMHQYSNGTIAASLPARTIATELSSFLHPRAPTQNGL